MFWSNFCTHLSNFLCEGAYVYIGLYHSTRIFMYKHLFAMTQKVNRFLRKRRKVLFVSAMCCMSVFAGAGNTHAAVVVTTPSPAAHGAGPLVYERSLNRKIEIAASNAVGRNYKVTDAKGRIICEGKIKPGGMIYIETAKIPDGTFQFYIDSYTLQQFIVL
jgi:hypothetical protein